MSNSVYKSDLEIARAAKIRHINTIAEKLNIPLDDLELYGKYKAKLPLHLLDEAKVSQSKLVLVTAITPTPAGEGKTTTSIGLTEGLNKIGKKATVVLREPSLGPVFGIKGGAAGGGYSQVIPMEDINLHFTGDFSAIEKANNLLAALIDNNLATWKRTLGLDHRTISWKRVMDMNDRSLRNVIIGLGGKSGGIPRETGFNITAASEIMAILCMASSLDDLKERMGNIYVGDTFDRKPIYARDLNAQGAMAALLKEAIKPNLVQTMEGNPAIIHGGPFANIAQGTNTIIATKMGLSLSDYVVTEAGFGADLGAEKFLNIKCRFAELSPSAVVIVATIRALKYHGGKPLDELKQDDVSALEKGLPNLQKHIENVKSFGLIPVVSINKFVSDGQEEIDFLLQACKEMQVRVAVCEGWEKGGEGSRELATQVAAACEESKGKFKPTYKLDSSVKRKISTIAQKIYGAESVNYESDAKVALRKIKRLGLENLPICMAKTQSSISDNPAILGRPEPFVLNVRDIEIAAGAGFLIPITGSILRMPGLPATPSAEHIDIDNDGNIIGLS